MLTNKLDQLFDGQPLSWIAVSQVEDDALEYSRVFCLLCPLPSFLPESVDVKDPVAIIIDCLEVT